MVGRVVSNSKRPQVGKKRILVPRVLSNYKRPQSWKQKIPPPKKNSNLSPWHIDPVERRMFSERFRGDFDEWWAPLKVSQTSSGGPQFLPRLPNTKREAVFGPQKHT